MPLDPTNTTKPKPCTVVDAHGFKRIYASQQQACVALGISYSKLLTWIRKGGRPVQKGRLLGYRFFAGAL